jgi:hypothetical protein
MRCGICGTVPRGAIDGEAGAWNVEPAGCFALGDGIEAGAAGFGAAGGGVVVFGAGAGVEGNDCGVLFIMAVPPA